MPTIALAGATTGLGHLVLQALLSQQPSIHKIVLLSRTPQPHLSALGVTVYVTEYTSHDSLVASLTGVHTLLSFIGGSSEALLHAQLALLAAAKEAGVKRFAPSEYAGSDYEGIDLYASKAEVWEAVKESGLQYTRFTCGLFMNLLGTGTPKPASEDTFSALDAKTGEEEALAGLRPWNFVINMVAGTADLPGDGTAQVVFTEMRDVARFVVAALNLEAWPEEFGMRGDVLSFRDVVRIVEEVQGRKLLVKENGVRDMAQVGDFYNQCRVKIVQGWGMVGSDCNDLFSDIKPTTVQEFVGKWWGGVEMGEAAWVGDVTFGEENMTR